MSFVVVIASCPHALLSNLSIQVPCAERPIHMQCFLQRAYDWLTSNMAVSFWLESTLWLA